MASRMTRWGGIVAVAGMLTLSACSTEGAAPARDDAVPAADLSAEAQAAAAIVESAMAPYDEFEAPGPELTGLDALAGSLVYYIPANLQVPMFTTVANAITDAFSNFDVEVRVCDAKANPQDAASCLSQAIDAGSKAVITGGVPDVMAPVAFEALHTAGIPHLSMQVQPEGEGDPTAIGYISPDNVELQSWNANWVIADSNAAANVLVVKVTDTPATLIWVEQGALATYEAGCPDCTVTVIEAHTGQLDKLPSLVSSALVANPDIEYVHAAFDVTVQPIIQGIQAAGRDDLKIVSMDGALSVMQDLAAGRFINSEVGFSQQALAWYSVDETLRMMVGQPSVQGHQFPFRRLFTQESASQLTLTPEAEASGEWYGEADYKAGFLALWGVK